MTDDFATAMRRALDRTRAGNPMEATRLIQEALGGDAGEATRRASGADETRRASGADETRRASGARQPLSDVLAGLARRPPGFDLPGRGAPRLPEIPEGAQFSQARHAGPHGARDYRLYVPSPQAGAVRGMVVMLHGCTQTPEDFALGTGMNRHAEAEGLAVLYPGQDRSQNAQGCWNWFRPGDRAREGGEAALLADLAGAVAAAEGVPEGRVFVAGLSAGGAMAAILAQTHPDLFAAAGVHSGLAPGSAQDVVSAFAAMRGEPARGAEALGAPAIIFHGSADATVAPVNAGRIAGEVAETGRRSGSAGGRRFDVLEGRNAAGRPVEVWRIEGAGHAWSGGDAGGSYVDAAGPDASAEMVRFFLSL